MRRLILLIVCLGGPALPSWGLWQATQYYLTVSHKYLDPKMQQYALIFELVVFYLAGLMELRSRWTTQNN